MKQQLTSAETALLAVLRSRPGVPFSREQLVRQLAETGVSDVDTLKRTIDVLVCYVRKKVGKDVIRTRKGVGYYAH